MDSLYSPSNDIMEKGSENDVEGRQSMFRGHSNGSLNALPSDQGGGVVRASTWESRAQELELELDLIREERRRVREELEELEREEERFRWEEKRKMEDENEWKRHQKSNVRNVAIPRVFGKI